MGGKHRRAREDGGVHTEVSRAATPLVGPLDALVAASRGGQLLDGRLTLVNRNNGTQIWKAALGLDNGRTAWCLAQSEACALSLRGCCTQLSHNQCGPDTFACPLDPPPVKWAADQLTGRTAVQ